MEAWRLQVATAIGRHQSDLGTGRENRSAVLHTAKPPFYFAEPNSIALIHPLYTILPSLLPPPLSLFLLSFYFTMLDRSIPGRGGGKKTRNESKQSSIDNVCAVRLTVRIVFPRSPSSSPFFFHLSMHHDVQSCASRRTLTRAHNSRRATLFPLCICSSLAGPAPFIPLLRPV